MLLEAARPRSLPSASCPHTHGSCLRGSAQQLTTSEPSPVCKSSMPWASVCLGVFTSFALHLVSTAEKVENYLGARSSRVTFKIFLILYLALTHKSHINRRQEMVGKLVVSIWGRKETRETQSESNFTRKKRSLRENGREGTEKPSYRNAQ